MAEPRMNPDEWARLRAHAIAPDATPAHWPKDVRMLSIDGGALIGIDGEGNLYWDGKPVTVRRKFDLTAQQTVIAWIAALATLAAAVAGGLQAWAAVKALEIAARAAGAT